MRINSRIFYYGLFLFALLFATSIGFAISCPSGCECLLGQEFLKKYGKPYSASDFCNGVQIVCSDDPDRPEFCFKIPSECGNSICELGEDSISCAADCLGTATTLKGTSDPGSHDWFYDPNATDILNEMLQLKINAGPQEDIKLINVTLTASGIGNDTKGVASTSAYWDKNKNGLVDSGDAPIGTSNPAYLEDNGNVTFTLNLKIEKNESKYVIIVYTMSAEATIGENYRFTVDSLIAQGEISGGFFYISGLPKQSGVKSIVAPPLPSCSGIVQFALTPDSVLANESINATVSNLSNCVDKKVKVVSNLSQCKFDIVIPTLPVCTCEIVDEGNGCSCAFIAPSNEGNYTYYACVDINGDNSVSIGEVDHTSLQVKQKPQLNQSEDEYGNCISDDSCTGNEKCIDGICLKMNGSCGYAENHIWNEYECGSSADCPVCPNNKVCVQNSCLKSEILLPNKIFVGEPTNITVLVGNKPYSNQEIKILDPKGRAVSIYTDEQGKGKFISDYEGAYIVSSVGITKTTVSVAKAFSFTDLFSSAILFFFEDPVRASLFVLLVVLVVIGGWWIFKKGQGDKLKRGKPEQFSRLPSFESKPKN